MGGGPPTAAAGQQLNGHLLFLLAWPEPKDVTDRIRHRFPRLAVTYRRVGGPESREPRDVPDELWKDVTILSTLGTLPKSAELVPNMEFIHLNSAGIDWLSTHPLYTHSTIPLTTSSGIHGPPISEWILMSLLTAAHKYNLLHAWQSRSHWGGAHGSPERQQLAGVRDHAGQRLGVLGYGSIGRQTARLASAMGMEVYAYTATPKETRDRRRDAGYVVPGTGDPEGEVPARWFSGRERARLHEFLAQDLDVLVVSVPLTAETRGLLGREEFELLGPQNRRDGKGRGAFVVNISRGKILVQEELIRALRDYEETRGESGLRGAALDVADPEPLPDGHELFAAPNCFVSPHVSANSEAYGRRAAEVLEENLARFERDGAKGLVNLVDRRRGY